MISAEQATAVCQSYRKNSAWLLTESAPGMDEVWRHVGVIQSAFRRIIDLRLALTLRHHGVTEFATANEKAFQNLGFSRVWNPLAGQ